MLFLFFSIRLSLDLSCTAAAGSIKCSEEKLHHYSAGAAARRGATIAEREREMNAAWKRNCTVWRWIYY